MYMYMYMCIFTRIHVYTHAYTPGPRCVVGHAEKINNSCNCISLKLSKSSAPVKRLAFDLRVCACLGVLQVESWLLSSSV